MKQYIDTIIDQLILWFTFLFIFIFVLVADSSRALEFSTKHDELTGLLRLKALEEEFLQLSSVRGYSNFATVIVKLDFYEEIHNSLGYEISDKILKKASERISINVDNRVLISRN
ncbi:diguanylate cyclase [Pseudoalteromonas sp. B193]